MLRGKISMLLVFKGSARETSLVYDSTTFKIRILYSCFSYNELRLFP